MAASTSITGIRYLDVRSTKVTDVGVMEYLSSPNSQMLEYLDISYLGAGITNNTLDVYAQSEHCKQLVVLKCRNSRIGNEGLVWLCESENAHYLEELDLSIVNVEPRTTTK